jgi:hypothetical protein
MPFLAVCGTYYRALDLVEPHSVLVLASLAFGPEHGGNPLHVAPTPVTEHRLNKQFRSQRRFQLCHVANRKMIELLLAILLLLPPDQVLNLQQIAYAAGA